MDATWRNECFSLLFIVLRHSIDKFTQTLMLWRDASLISCQSSDFSSFLVDFSAFFRSPLDRLKGINFLELNEPLTLTLTVGKTMISFTGKNFHSQLTSICRAQPWVNPKDKANEKKKLFSRISNEKLMSLFSCLSLDFSFFVKENFFCCRSLIKSSNFTEKNLIKHAWERL